MSLWMSILLGVVQGLAEFLPISSSGHLALFQEIFHVQLADVEEDLFLFDILVHFGTLFAVFAAYRREIGEVLAGFGSFFTAKGRANRAKAPARRLIVLLVLATIPVVGAVFFSDKAEALTKNLYAVGLFFMLTGILLFVADHLKRGRSDERNATLLDVIVVGLAQLLAVFPGLSRSGTTITAGLWRGFDRKFAVKFSFFMSIPAVLGAVVLQLKDFFEQNIPLSALLPFVPGMIAAAVSGYFAISFVRWIAQKGKFGGFSVYCFILGCVVVAGEFIATH